MPNSQENKRDVVGVPVSPEGIGDVAWVLDRRDDKQAFIVTFVNPHACFVQGKHDDYTELLEAFDRVACDGIGMILACRIAGLRYIEREAFDLTSMAPPVLDWAARNGKKVVLVGGREGIAGKAAAILQDMVPKLQIEACFSGYGNGPGAAMEYARKWQTDVVICGMGAPLQERFLVRLAATGWYGAGFTCGGFLEQTAQGGAYFPDWIDRLNLRFLYRLVREPRRLWRRYLVEYQVFVGRFLVMAWQRIAGIFKPGGA